ncbi:hypothetical protein KMU_16380 [Proteus vulgaris]|uniref:hypothetical protein n=1 Tax=Proteus TaxID=583 RepID=UPI0015998CE2|nr:MULTISPECIES: hypothetical protein [Proteus]MBG2711789.1 hypothetical protein [Proteus mirabilis]MBG2768526.1 hypothetical protein [Proteus mirabilis]QKJ48896.1 hypothetical protein G9394_10130 [Proteus vulgaris]GLX63597.1 hypothetical protein KMU_16380 [Proteus vulgaris]
MIEQFDTQMLEKFGLKPENFDADFLQWTYTFIKESIKLDLVYSMDKTISTSLYVNNTLTVFCFGYGLKLLRIDKDKIYGETDFNGIKRSLEIDPLNITFKWEDSF